MVPNLRDSVNCYRSTKMDDRNLKKKVQVLQKFKKKIISEMEKRKPEDGYFPPKKMCIN